MSDDELTADQAAQYIGRGSTFFHQNVKPYLPVHRKGALGTTGRRFYIKSDLEEYERLCRENKLQELESDLKSPRKAPMSKSAKTVRTNTTTTSRWKGRALEDLRRQTT